jgi:Holliday junction resolvasome RuvABC DNA-binding subunit
MDPKIWNELREKYWLCFGNNSYNQMLEYSSKALSFLTRTMSSDSEDLEETERGLCKQQDVDALVDMGYNAKIATEALVENDNVLPLAVEALMRSEHSTERRRY